jgi:hypothetical protein
MFQISTKLSPYDNEGTYYCPLPAGILVKDYKVALKYMSMAQPYLAPAKSVFYIAVSGKTVPLTEG